MFSKIKLLYNQLPITLFIYLLIVKVFDKTLTILFCMKHYSYKISFSQGGEDVILEHLFKNKKTGIFIDVGCNHPIESNNTFYLYKKGWKGLNIDGNIKLINLYSKFRPNDISLCKIVSDTEKIVTYYVSKSNKVSTIDEKFYQENNNSFEYNSGDFVNSPTFRLDNILLNTNIDTGNIDLLTIDVEGHDINVLFSINLIKIRPKVICIEDHEIKLDDLHCSEIYKYLIKNGYTMKYYAISSCFYIDENINL
jgi:FkbM family methyltransferase